MQACAKQCLGLAPVQFPPFLNKSPICKLPYIIELQQREYFWQPANYNDCWFFDALTIDPSQLLSDETVIWERGRPQPVQERKLSNANIGSLPKELMYIAVHPLHGCLVFWPFHGAKHGGAADGKEALGGMYEGCPFWYTGLPEFYQEHIADTNYYNKHEAVLKASSATRQRVQAPLNAAKGIDGNNFLVRR